MLGRCYIDGVKEGGEDVEGLVPGTVGCGAAAACSMCGNE